MRGKIKKVLSGAHVCSLEQRAMNAHDQNKQTLIKVFTCIRLAWDKDRNMSVTVLTIITIIWTSDLIHNLPQFQYQNTSAKIVSTESQTVIQTCKAQQVQLSKSPIRTPACNKKTKSFHCMSTKPFDHPQSLS